MGIGNIACSVFICYSGGYTGTGTLLMSLYKPSPLNWQEKDMVPVSPD
jgi:hypothetical protein